MSALTVIRAAFLEVEEVGLGCFVPDATNPSQDFWPEKPYSFPPDEITIRSIVNLRQLLSDGRRASLSGKLSHFLTGDVATQSELNIELVAPKSNFYLLKQPKSLFLRLCQDGKTKMWMEE